jgi:hypothetical protein
MQTTLDHSTKRLWGWVGWACCAAIATCIVIVGLLTVSPRADAQAPGACGSVLLSGGSWLNGGGVDVYSNGSDEGTGASCAGGDHYQCVELINRLYQMKGWISGTWSGNGGRSSPGVRNSLWDEAPANLSKQANGSISYVGPGDEVSINVYDGSTFEEDGHALIVNNSTSVTSGTVYLVSQNSGDASSANPQITATLSNGTLTIPNSGAWSYPVIGVVHAPGGGNAGGAPSEGSFVSYQGNVYRIVGGAALYIGNCGPIPDGCTNVTPVSGLSQFYPTVANGTVIVDQDHEGGGYWRAAGGHILPVTSCIGADASVCAGPNVVLPYETIENYDAAHPTVESGTVIVDLDHEGGGYLKAAGGTIVPVTSCSGVDEPVCLGSAVQLPYATIQLYDAEHPTVANGTVIVDLDHEGGGYLKAAGGTILPITSCSGLDAPVCEGPSVQLPYGSIELYDADHSSIAEGTVLHDLDFEGGGYFTIEHGAVAPITSCTGAYEHLCTGPSVLLPYGTIESYAAGHLRPSTPNGGSNLGAPAFTNSNAGPPSNQTETPMPSHGVLGTKASKPPKITSALSRALAKCRKTKQRRKRLKCEASTRRRYGYAKKKKH